MGRVIGEVQALGGGGSGWRVRGWSSQVRNGIASETSFTQEPRIAEVGIAGAFTQITIWPQPEFPEVREFEPGLLLAEPAAWGA